MLTGASLPQEFLEAMLIGDIEDSSKPDLFGLACQDQKTHDPCGSGMASTIPSREVVEALLEDEVDRLAQALSLKFEELTLINQLNEQLSLGEDSRDIYQSLLEQLEICTQSATIAIDLHPDEEYECPGIFLSAGQPCDPRWLRAVAADAVKSSEGLGQVAQDGEPIAVMNSPTPESAASVRSVVVPIHRGSKSLGQMIAVRPLSAEEFGTVEADLMASTSTILAAHLINQRQYHEMQQMFEETIHSLVSALDAKDTYTFGHSSRVAELAVQLAERLGYNKDGLNRMQMAGLLHDIGKIGVEDSVLRKPGRLTDEEFEKIKVHPVLGFEMLQGIRPFRDILPAVRHHHEAWDGTGYPDGLSGDGIPRDAQILAVADAFDAMTSDRPYRNGMPLDLVVEIFKQGRGTQWAADVVDMLLSSPITKDSCVNRENVGSPRNIEHIRLD